MEKKIIGIQYNQFVTDVSINTMPIDNAMLDGLNDEISLAVSRFRLALADDQGMQEIVLREANHKVAELVEKELTQFDINTVDETIKDIQQVKMGSLVPTGRNALTQIGKAIDNAHKSIYPTSFKKWLNKNAGWLSKNIDTRGTYDVNIKNITEAKKSVVQVFTDLDNFLNGIEVLQTKNLNLVEKIKTQLIQVYALIKVLKERNIAIRNTKVSSETMKMEKEVLLASVGTYIIKLTSQLAVLTGKLLQSGKMRQDLMVAATNMVVTRTTLRANAPLYLEHLLQVIGQSEVAEGLSIMHDIETIFASGSLKLQVSSSNTITQSLHKSVERDLESLNKILQSMSSPNPQENKSLETLESKLKKEATRIASYKKGDFARDPSTRTLEDTVLQIAMLANRASTMDLRASLGEQINNSGVDGER